MGSLVACLLSRGALQNAPAALADALETLLGPLRKAPRLAGSTAAKTGVAAGLAALLGVSYYPCSLPCVLQLLTRASGFAGKVPASWCKQTCVLFLVYSIVRAGILQWELVVRLVSKQCYRVPYMIVAWLSPGAPPLAWPAHGALPGAAGGAARRQCKAGAAGTPTLMSRCGSWPCTPHNDSPACASQPAIISMPKTAGTCIVISGRCGRQALEELALRDADRRVREAAAWALAAAAAAVRSVVRAAAAGASADEEGSARSAAALNARAAAALPEESAMRALTEHAIAAADGPGAPHAAPSCIVKCRCHLSMCLWLGLHNIVHITSSC